VGGGAGATVGGLLGLTVSLGACCYKLY